MTKSSPAFPADEALLQILCSLASNPMYKSGWDRINLEELSYQSDIILQSKLAIENYYRENPVFGVSKDKEDETK